MQHSTPRIRVDRDDRGRFGERLGKFGRLRLVVKREAADHDGRGIRNRRTLAIGEMDAPRLRRIVELIDRLAAVIARADRTGGAEGPHRVDELDAIAREIAPNLLARRVVADHRDERRRHTKLLQADRDVQRRAADELAHAVFVTQFVDQRVANDDDPRMPRPRRNPHETRTASTLSTKDSRRRRAPSMRTSTIPSARTSSGVRGAARRTFSWHVRSAQM